MCSSFPMQAVWLQILAYHAGRIGSMVLRSVETCPQYVRGSHKLALEMAQRNGAVNEGCSAELGSGAHCFDQIDSRSVCSGDESHTLGRSYGVR